jgi:hypothetical protein
MRLVMPRFNWDKKSLLRKQIVVAFFFLLAIGEFGIIPHMINKEKIKEDFISSFRQLTGLTIDIQGDAQVHAFPRPHIVINSLEVHNPPSAARPFMFTLDKVDLTPTIGSLMRGKFVVSSIEFDGAVINLEKMKDSKFNVTKLLAPQESVDAGVSSPNDVVSPQKADDKTVRDFLNADHIAFKNSFLRYSNTPGGSEFTCDIVRLDFANRRQEAPSTIDMALRYNDKPIEVTGRIDNFVRALENDVSPLSLEAKSGKDFLVYNGMTGIKSGFLAMEGKIRMGLEDFIAWTTIPADMKGNKAFEITRKPVPVQLASSFSLKENAFSMPDLTLDGAFIKANLVLTLDKTFHAELSGKIRDLDLETFFASGLIASPPSVKKEDQINHSLFLGPSPKSWFSFLDIHANLKMDQASYNGQQLKNGHFEFDMINDEMTVSLADFAMPGDARLAFTGIGKESYNGFTLEGEVTVAGDNFIKTTEFFKTRSLALPPEDFGRFRAQGNMVLSSADIRLSEIRARIENIGMVGGVIATFAASPQIRVALKLSGLNLDHFTALWGVGRLLKRSLRSDSFEGVEDAKSSYLVGWLQNLGSEIDFSGIFDGFKLNEKDRERASFRLRVKKNVMALTKLDVVYNGSELRGDFKLDISDQLPQAKIDAVFDTLDVARFFDLPPEAPASKNSENRWSRKEMNFYWINSINADFHIRAGHFKYGWLDAENFDMTGNTGNGHLAVDNISGGVRGAQAQGQFNVSSEKIARFNMSGDVTGVQPERFVDILPGLTGLSGKFSVSSRLDTSGINFASWIANLEGTIGVGGKDIVVQQFNLPGIIRAVAYVRSVANILNVVKRAFPGGDTPFTSIEGQSIVGSGIIKIANMHIVSPNADGVFLAQIDLPNWKMEGRTILFLRKLNRMRPPTITINMEGDIDGPQKLLDTRLLEDYVTNRTSSQMIREYVPLQ